MKFNFTTDTIANINNLEAMFETHELFPVGISYNAVCDLDGETRDIKTYADVVWRDQIRDTVAGASIIGEVADIIVAGYPLTLVHNNGEYRAFIHKDGKMLGMLNDYCAFSEEPFKWGMNHVFAVLQGLTCEDVERFISRQVA